MSGPEHRAGRLGHRRDLAAVGDLFAMTWPLPREQFPIVGIRYTLVHTYKVCRTVTEYVCTQTMYVFLHVHVYVYFHVVFSPFVENFSQKAQLVENQHFLGGLDQ